MPEEVIAIVLRCVRPLTDQPDLPPSHQGSRCQPHKPGEPHPTARVAVAQDGAQILAEHRSVPSPARVRAGSALDGDPRLPRAPDRVHEVSDLLARLLTAEQEGAGTRQQPWSGPERSVHAQLGVVSVQADQDHVIAVRHFAQGQTRAEVLPAAYTLVADALGDVGCCPGVHGTATLGDGKPITPRRWGG